MTTDDKRAAFQRLAHSPAIHTAQEYADTLSERPEPTMQIGDRVVWTIDGEPGTVVALNDSLIAVRWQESGIEVYSLTSGAFPWPDRTRLRCPIRFPLIDAGCRRK